LIINLTQLINIVYCAEFTHDKHKNGTGSTATYITLGTSQPVFFKTRTTQLLFAFNHVFLYSPSLVFISNY